MEARRDKRIRIFKSKAVARSAKKLGISEASLVGAATRANLGEVDASLGGNVFKQRIARTGQGKSGGFRVLIIVRREHIAFIVYAFAKNDRSDVGARELQALKDLADVLLGMDDTALRKATANGTLIELR